jgi:alanine racemase
MLYQTHAVVHLDNIKKNLMGVRQRVGSNRKILVAVKANAYGHGAIEVGRLCERIGMDYLGVATVPEGIELRKAGIRLPILKLSHAFPEEMEAAVKNRIALTVCDLANAKALQKVAALARKKATVYIKVDTGMGRIGVSVEDAPKLAEYVAKKCKNLILEGVLTHFPVSDSPVHDSFTKEQISIFKNTVVQMEQAMGRNFPIVSAANSGGILAHPDSWFDMVRPGIMTYGFCPDPSTPKTVELYPGLSFLTKVSFLKKVKKGTSLSYGRTFVAPEDGWAATFSAGYADGFNRLFSNKGRVLIRGRSYPVAGRVCMDQSIAFIGPELNGIKIGDKVTLIGHDGSEEITVYEWAQKLGTITYEVTCQINSRVVRYARPITKR